MLNIRLFCTAIQLNVPTINGRVYSKETLDKIVEQTNRKAASGHCFLVTNVERTSASISLAEVVGRINVASLFDGQMLIDVELLDTPKGLPIRALPQEAVEKLTVFPIMYGTTKPDLTVDAASIALTGWALE